MTVSTLTLHAEDLASKWGFNDGDIPDHIWDALELEADERLDEIAAHWHDVLRRLVRKHLVPLLPEGVRVYDIETIHNPIRTDHWGKPSDEGTFESAPDIEVTVTINDILTAAEETE